MRPSAVAADALIRRIFIWIPFDSIGGSRLRFGSRSAGWFALLQSLANPLKRSSRRPPKDTQIEVENHVKTYFIRCHGLSAFRHRGKHFCREQMLSYRIRCMTRG